jgi:hypothetical protein
VARKWHDEHPHVAFDLAHALFPGAPFVDHPEALMDIVPDADTHTEFALKQAANDHHRLAGADIGTGRSSGSALLEEALALLWPKPVEPRSDESLEDWTRRYRARTERALRLEAAAIEAAEAIHQADIARRRVERRQAALRRRAARDAQRAQGGMYADQKRRPNQPVHVEVDPSAWNAVKRAAMARRTTVGQAVADLIVDAVVGRVRPRRNPQRAPTHRFARLFVDDQTWASFRTFAHDVDVPAGRLVGLVVEREARRMERGEVE